MQSFLFSPQKPGDLMLQVQSKLQLLLNERVQQLSKIESQRIGLEEEVETLKKKLESKLSMLHILSLHCILVSIWFVFHSFFNLQRHSKHQTKQVLMGEVLVLRLLLKISQDSVENRIVLIGISLSPFYMLCLALPCEIVVFSIFSSFLLTCGHLSFSLFRNQSQTSQMSKSDNNVINEPTSPVFKMQQRRNRQSRSKSPDYWRWHSLQLAT